MHGHQELWGLAMQIQELGEMVTIRRKDRKKKNKMRPVRMKTSILTFSCNLDVFMSHCKLDDADSIWTRPTERFFCLESTSNFLTYLELSKRRETNRQTSSTQSKLGPPTPFRTWSRHTLAFFVHAVRGRRSDGHQNVLWSVNYSQVVREQVKCMWKPRKRITDLFHCRSWAKHPHI